MDMKPAPDIPVPGMTVRPAPGSSPPLAMAFVTPQPEIVNTFAPGDALRAGTLFPELYKPFLGRRGEM